MARKSAVRRLPDDIRAYIEGELARGRLTLDALIGELRRRWPEAADAGDLPSRSAVHRYGQKLERRLEAIRASTEAAKIIQAQAGDSKDARSEALTALIQTELFEAILQAQEAVADADDPEETGKRIKVLSAAARNIATLTRSSIDLKKFQAEVAAGARAELVAEQRANLEKIAKTQGMGREQVDFWVKEFLGVR